MTSSSTAAQGVDRTSLPAGSLSIGQLAQRTGVSTAVLRTWETRHGFPVPHRTASGHRRYAETAVEAVRTVVQRRDAGLRLELAIAAAIAAVEPSSPSVFAELRRRHPEVVVHRLRKSTLLALSWAIEDEFCARAERARIFGSFQHQQYFAGAEARWQQLARLASSTMAFGDFTGAEPQAPDDQIIKVDLGPDDPMQGEWAVVCDAFDLPVALTAWELPGQSTVPDGHRIFEALWTVEPGAVRNAARVCARVAQEHGVAEATPLLYELAEEPLPGVLDARSVTTLFNRVVAYVDRFGA